MASNISNMINSKLRFTGMVSGLDTDTIIKQLMAVEKTKVDKVKQNKTLVEWRRDNYREITNTLRSFQDEFFDVTKPANNMRSLNTYNQYTTTSTESKVATATGGAGVTSTAHTLEVLDIAKAAAGNSSGTVTKALSGSPVKDFTIDNYNRSMLINYNGVSKEITLPNGSYTDAASLLGDGSDGKLKHLIQKAFGSNVTISESGGKLQFSSKDPSDALTIYTKSGAGDEILSALGLNTNGLGSKLNFDSPIQIKKGMKLELTTTEAGASATKVIQWDADKAYGNMEELVADLQSRMDTALGAGKLTVTAAEGKLAFTAAAGVDGFSLNNSDIVKDLGFQSGDSNKLSLSDTLDKIGSKLAGGAMVFDAAGKFTLTINNTDIEISKTDTLSTLISKVNNSSAGTTLNYSAYSDTFSMAAKETGAGTIALDDNGSGFFSKIKLTSSQITAGQDASFVLDGEAGSRKNNSFSVDGVTYTLAAKGTTTISLSQNTDEIYNKIKGFVDKYNELIAKINGELSEKYNRSYTPLTDDQKQSMSEEQIKKWEEQAKTGLLKNDSMLNNMAISMRKALSDSIQDVSGGLSGIGITTGTYLEKGKLVIDANKLKEAIKNNPDKVMNLFAKESSVAYSDTTNGNGSKSERYAQNGFANRLYDILRDHIRTTRDKDGNKGLLIEKAGLTGDLSEFKNLMSQDIDKKNTLIDQMTKKLYAKEDAYYKKYAALETAMSKMNSQASWLTSQSSSK
jgi:flagellar hook-associated protein 2